MKKYLTVVAALLLVLAFTATGFAHGGRHGGCGGGGYYNDGYGYCDGYRR